MRAAFRFGWRRSRPSSPPSPRKATNTPRWSRLRRGAPACASSSTCATKRSTTRFANIRWRKFRRCWWSARRKPRPIRSRSGAWEAKARPCCRRMRRWPRWSRKRPRRTSNGRGWRRDDRRTGTAGLSDPGLPADPGSQSADRGGAGDRNRSGPQPVPGHARNSGRSRQGCVGAGGEDAAQEGSSLAVGSAVSFACRPRRGANHLPITIGLKCPSTARGRRHRVLCDPPAFPMKEPALPDAIDLLKTRRSIKPREMGEPGPSPAELETILTIGARVPDHGKLTPWRFIVFEGDARVRAGEVIAKVFARKNPQAPPAEIDIEKRRLTDAPLVIAVVSLTKPHPKVPPWEQELSAGASAMNIVTAATALGYGACWLTGWFAFDRDVLDGLGLKADEKLAGFIHIGTPSKTIEDRPRPALSDIVTRF